MTGQPTWRMYAGRRRSTGVLCDIGNDPRYPRMHGHDSVVEVDVTETPDGDYWGWLATVDRFTGEPRENPYPVMIYERESLFRICFPYGPEATEATGQGRIVRLTVTPADPTSTGEHR